MHGSCFKNSLESSIHNLPTLTWVKDLDYRYIASSSRLIKLIGYRSKTHLYNRDDFNHPWAQFAEMYREEDSQVLSGKSLTFLQPVKFSKSEEFLIITRKYPFYNKKNEIIGIMGNITIPTSPQLMQYVLPWQKNDFELCATNKNTHNFNRYHAGKLFPNINLSEQETPCLLQDFTHSHFLFLKLLEIKNISLTSREIACIKLTVRGKTAKEIGSLLNISYRTVESYLENIKCKLKVNSKRELIELVMQAIFEK